jgi:hypothetical protein
VNGDKKMAEIQGELPPLPSLLTVYAPSHMRDWHRLCWLLDQRLAAVVRRGGEPTIAAIRLAWWDAVLVEGDRSKGGGEPLVEAWRVRAFADAAPLAERLIDGWRTLLGPEMPAPDELAAFAEGRGYGLFGLIAGRDGEDMRMAGAAWALWDLAGHTSDPALAAAALESARFYLAQVPVLPRAAAPKPLRLLHRLAVSDIHAGREPAGFEGRHYRSLFLRGLLP